MRVKRREMVEQNSPTERAFSPFRRMPNVSLGQRATPPDGTHDEGETQQLRLKSVVSEAPPIFILRCNLLQALPMGTPPVTYSTHCRLLLTVNQSLAITRRWRVGLPARAPLRRHAPRLATAAGC
jgi:hypothetical protein